MDSSNTFTQHLSIAMLHLTDKNIIHSVQYISNEETQIDRDGPESTWNQSLLCIEKTENDYIFHFFKSDYLQSYSYPYFKLVNKFHPFCQKLSDLHTKFSDIFCKSYGEINSFINYWNEDLHYTLNSKDTDLNIQMAILNDKIDELEIIKDQKYQIMKEKQDKERKEYEMSDAYKEYLNDVEERTKKEQNDYNNKEEERLTHLIKMFGEVEGPKYMRL
jgi:hypothetical protein